MLNKEQGMMSKQGRKRNFQYSIFNTQYSMQTTALVRVTRTSLNSQRFRTLHSPSEKEPDAKGSIKPLTDLELVASLNSMVRVT